MGEGGTKTTINDCHDPLICLMPPANKVVIENLLDANQSKIRVLTNLLYSSKNKKIFCHQEKVLLNQKKEFAIGYLLLIPNIGDYVIKLL